jgi:hypothetical protein
LKLVTLKKTYRIETNNQELLIRKQNEFTSQVLPTVTNDFLFQILFISAGLSLKEPLTIQHEGSSWYKKAQSNRIRRSHKLELKMRIITMVD